jgi:hypothetical protein
MSLMQSIPAPVLQAFKEIAPAHRNALLDVRQLIFEVANLALTQTPCLSKEPTTPVRGRACAPLWSLPPPALILLLYLI